LLLGLAFGLLLLAANSADLFIARPLAAGQSLMFTLRVPGIGVYQDTIESGGATYQYVRKIFPRGSALTPEQLRLVQAVEETRRPPRPTLLLGFGLVFTLVLFLFSRYSSSDGKAGELRTQVVLVTYLGLFAVACKAFLLLTPYSAMWLPLALVVAPIALHLGWRTATLAAVAGAVLLSFHTGIDLALLFVLLGQGLSVAALAGLPTRPRGVWAGLGACAGGGMAYLTSSLLLQQPLLAGSTPPLDQGLVAALAAGPAGAILALPIRPLLGFALGIVSRGKLHTMANLDAPLLKQLASKAPGTWAHSMSMANMAEMAANAIGADALLVRVGAYYHDLGKAAQPRYFIENQDGSDNPHDELAPEVSADAIFSHVTEGVKAAHKHKLPRQVIDFIYSHHGQAVLEFFWHKNQQSKNPRQLAEDDFRYPGYPPRTRESAILSLCDAVEAASRTLEDPSTEAIRKLVWQIALGKLDQGHFDQSGLTLAELNKVMDSLVETLRSSRHGRIRYPWQDDSSPSAAAPAPGSPAWAASAEEGRERVRTRPLGMRNDKE